MHPIQRSSVTLLACLLFLSSQSQETVLPNTDPTDEVFMSKKDILGKPYPAFTISNDSKTWTNESLKGKIVYINFWFTACMPCMAEMPQLNELYEKYKGDSNFVFLSITFDPPKKIDSIKKAYSIGYEIYRLSLEESHRLHPLRYYPASIILDDDGIVRCYETGGMVFPELIRRQFKRTIYPVLDFGLKDD